MQRAFVATRELQTRNDHAQELKRSQLIFLISLPITTDVKGYVRIKALFTQIFCNESWGAMNTFIMLAQASSEHSTWRRKHIYFYLHTNEYSGWSVKADNKVRCRGSDK